MSAIVAGVFVGGHGRRMGGVHKGLLRAPDSPRSLAERTVALAREVADDVVLVGHASAYASLGCEAIADAAPSGPRDDGDVGGEESSARGRWGPLAGLVALLERAGKGRAIALACDMPHVTTALLARLATTERDALALAPRRGGKWEPLFARYDAPRTLPMAMARLDARKLSLQPLLDALDARELRLDDAERAQLDDWDEPGDVA